MGATLNIAREMKGYTLTDRATWEAFRNKESLDLVFDGDPRMRNDYGIIMVNPELHRHIKVDLASVFIRWIVSKEGQAVINGFRTNGKQTFFGNAENIDNISSFPSASRHWL